VEFATTPRCSFTPVPGLRRAVFRVRHSRLNRGALQTQAEEAPIRNIGTSNSARYPPAAPGAFALRRHTIRLFGFESSVGRQSDAIRNATGIDPVESLIEVCSARHKIQSQVVRLCQAPRVVRLMQASTSATCFPAASGMSGRIDPVREPPIRPGTEAIANRDSPYSRTRPRKRIAHTIMTAPIVWR